jgi:hypothetical protein
MSINEEAMKKKKRKNKQMKRNFEEMIALEQYLNTQNEFLTRHSLALVEEKEKMKEENKRLHDENCWTLDKPTLPVCFVTWTNRLSWILISGDAIVD